MDDSLTFLGIMLLIALVLFGIFALYKFFTLAPEWAIWASLVSIPFSFVTAVLRDS